MAGSFLDAAMDLLGRPGNTVRGLLTAGPEGALQGLTGARQFDPTELPGINQLPDEGLSLGPVHLTPRTLAGFAGGTLLDPLTYLGGGLGHAGAGLLRGADAGLDLLGAGGRLSPELEGMFQGGVTHPHFQIPTSDTILPRLEDYSGGSSDIVGDAAKGGSELAPQYAPAAEATPVGDQKYAQAKDRLDSKKSDLNVLKNKAGTAEDWLDYTSSAAPTSGAQSWEDVIGVKRGTRPEDALGKQEASDVDYSRPRRDLTNGAGGTEPTDIGLDAPVSASRQQVLQHLQALQDQIDALSHTLNGDKGSRFGDPLDKRGMENTLSDWQAKRQLAADPSLAQTEMGNTRRSYEQWAAQNGRTARPGLSDKQTQVAQNKTAQQLSRDETFRRSPDSRYYNRGSADSAPDEANMDLTAERDTRAPHGDPLEEARAQKAESDKFGRKGAGTYQSGDELGMDENSRPGGLRDTTPDVGLVDHLGRDTATDPRAMPSPKSRTSEMTADAGDSQGVQLAIERIRTEWILNALRQGLYRGSSTIGNFPK